VPIGGGSCVPPPPSTIDTGPSNAGTIADNTPTFAFSSTETGATFECKLDAGSFAACTNPFTPSSPLSDGSHQFQERAVQNGGNPALSPELGAVNTRTFTVDTTGPVITFTSGPGEGGTIDTSSASIGFSGNEPGTFACKLDGGSFGACSSPFAASSLSEGAHSVQLRGTDTVGNVGAVAIRNFSVQFPVVTPPAGPTGQRAAALKKCKKKKSATARKKCKNNANKLPV
jgi:hypothetical protein